MLKDGLKKSIQSGKINFNLKFYFNSYNRFYYKKIKEKNNI